MICEAEPVWSEVVYTHEAHVEPNKTTVGKCTVAHRPNQIKYQFGAKLYKY
jgi:hypothetical protein